MTCSTWGTWFIHDEVEAVTPDGLSIWFIGCNGFILRTATTTVYVDPYLGRGRPPQLIRMLPIPFDPASATSCDAVLVTHEHLDHMHPPSIVPLVRDLGAALYAPRAAYTDSDVPVDRSVFQHREHEVAPGECFDVGDLQVNVHAAHDPDAIEPVTYVIEHEHGTLFLGGDTRESERFYDLGDRYDIDLGMLATGSAGRQYFPEDASVRTRTVYMDEDEVIAAANALELDRLAPVHHRMWRGVTADVSGLATRCGSFPFPYVVERIDIGDRLDIHRPGVQLSHVLVD